MEQLPRIDELILWFGRNGGYINEAIRLLHSTEYGCHFVSRGGRIASQEIVCKCPFNLTLSYLNVEQAKSPAAGHPHFVEGACSKLLGIPQIEKQTVRIFLIVDERLKGQDSFWHPYLQLLPDMIEMHTPLLKDKELVYLKGTNLFPSNASREETPIGRQEASLRAQWKLGVDALKGTGNCIDGLTW
ncbi:hypothetical protein F4859DRAFT_527190 [Xylaria cf. heliscus]|nr:hypothetical protein F4859DRAFT_527190 [Xylaria cf. heliscus]